jgi:polyphosphate kinase
VLEEALDESVPLLEWIKFLATFSSNLDEFFMVRVARLKERLVTGDGQTGPDGLTPAQTLAAISTRVHQLVEEQHHLFLHDLQPRLATEGIRVWTSLDPAELAADQVSFLDDYFERVIFPVVTPLAIDPGHPFPYLANRSLCLVVALRRINQSNLPEAQLSIVHIPTHVVPRFIAIPAPAGQFHFVMLEDVIQFHLPQLYPGYEILSCHAVRVTRVALDGDKDLTFLVVPSRERALELNKAYRVLVKEQNFVFGRESLIAQPLNVHRKIENGSTDLSVTERVCRDGRLWLDWNHTVRE